MRIIAGQFKGARLYSPKNNLVRPTSDRVREFIFSYLGPDVQGAMVLDLFAGTGAFGIEAISRGAKESFFVDVSTASIELTSKNSDKVGISAKTFRMRAEQYLKKAIEQNRVFDIIFCDPPYNYNRIEKIMSTILSLDLLEKKNGLIIYESSSKNPVLPVDGFFVAKEKQMGDTQITVYKKL